MTDPPARTGDGVARDADELARRLGAFFDARWDRAGHVVRELRRLSGGASRETWSLDLARPDSSVPPRPLVLQRVRAGALSASFSMVGEEQLLRAAHAAGVPVAPAVASSDDASVIGAPFVVVERVEGETIARRILRDEAFAPARAVLVEQAAAALAAIHALPPTAVPSLRADEPIGQLRSLLDWLGETDPAFELAFRWLAANRPPPAREARAAIVHGDFRLGNLVVGPDGLRAVLDWELAHLGDPMEDLGWFCVRAWRFGEPAPVAGLGDYDRFFTAYEAAGGVPVDAGVVRWWEVLGTLRWGVICMLQAHGHLSGQSRSVELAAIGRRVCETEHDLLRLIRTSSTGSSSATAEAATAATVEGGYDGGAHGAPSAPQLLEAVREFLERDVRDATEGRVQFHARVAANVLGMVERELQAGVAMAAAHRARLAALGFTDDRELAAAIRAGALDHRMDEVTVAVAATVADKVAVANPGYVDG